MDKFRALASAIAGPEQYTKHSHVSGVLMQRLSARGTACPAATLRGALIPRNNSDKTRLGRYSAA
eukprot:4149597-Pleurochrysis_carterae.AAC.1